MKARTLTRALGVILSAALVIASQVFAHSPYYSGHVDHDYSYGGHVDHEYGTGWYGDRDYAYGGYGDPGMAGRLTTVTAPTMTATGILPGSWGTGGRMHGIMRAVTIIITGSKRKENVYEQAHRERSRVEWTPAAGVCSGSRAHP
ncbi:MAG: hypothetical protein HYZ72_10950 [Deltaproteobacteria bacterium]|nr:hypothetical protein [Deltaproteobacteria bacterium]